MGTTEIIISLVGGFFAGTMNTLAGFGSIITLAIYTDVLGIPGHIANATNRVNVLGSTSISSYTFYKSGKLDFKNSKTMFALVLVGAIVGVYLATQLDDQGFKQAFKYILIPVLLILLVNPKKFIDPDDTSKALPRIVTFPLYFLIGIYAGFIQAGFGVLFILIAVMLSKVNLVIANGLKLTLIAFYTLVVLLIFHFNGMVMWQSGIAITIGQMIGGYFAAKQMVNMKSANKYAYWILVVIVVGVIIKNFELWKLFV